ncbi:MAG: potassium-transporting ATPase subunit KdpA [Pedobacter sp.]|nr:potassium-transporting ATPase subunit KdpA [Pedobacter sp.]
MSPLVPLTLVYLLVLAALAQPLAKALLPLARGNPLRPFEQKTLRLLGADGQSDMDWKRYALAVLAFNVVGLVFVYAVQRLQGFLTLNPEHFGAVAPDLAFNTAISFVTNTNWQAYGGESTMSPLTQMLVLTVQNFVSAATGMAVAFALMRAFVREKSPGLGNFWTDLFRITLYVLLPISLLYALFLVSQGVVQTFASSISLHTLEGSTQTLALGPVASQEAIKMLGTNGGGFFNANSAHPFENPNALTNFVQMLSIFLIPAALCITFGHLVGNQRQGWTLLGAMTIIFLLVLLLPGISEQQGNPLLAKLGVDQSASALQAGGNMEGKEVRFGIAASSLFAIITTAASCGAVNAMHDSFTALGGMGPMWLMQLGEVVFGGVGAGFYGVMLYALLAVFVAGLMIGRTPEYLGRKLGKEEMRLVMIALILPSLLILGMSALAVLAKPGLTAISNPGAHGFSQVLYAFSSATANNGSAFAGLGANTSFYNGLLGLCMWLGRFGVIIPILAIAGSLVHKKRLPENAGTLPTGTTQFAILLAVTILIVGALTFLPALALGPLAEQLTLLAQ